MIKLNIQRFSSTNKTTHYELSQYVSSDLPTYLVDYNSDMSKIDTGINTAQTTADTASTAATNAAAAAETAQTTANTAVTNAATADGKAETAQSRIGTLANLTTTAKTDLVDAINEVDGNCDSNTAKIGTLSSLETTIKTDLVSAVNEVNSSKKSKGVVLYSDNTGTTGNVTLNETSSNYRYIEIVFKQYQGYSNSIELDLLRDNKASLGILFSLNNVMYFDEKSVTISGTTITVNGYAEAYIAASGTHYDATSNNISIIEVIGYKD